MTIAKLPPIPDELIAALDDSLATLERMTMDRIPERPLQPPHTFNERIPFNEYDDAIMHDILGKRFGPVVQTILERLHALKATKGSFGVDDSRALQALLPDLEALRQACVDEWADQ